MCFFSAKKGDDSIGYPKIINKDNEVIAILNNLETCTIQEIINGAYTLSFVATVDDLKTQFLYDEDNIIEVNNDLFKPLDIVEIHADNNELTVSVYCEHISYNLLEHEFDNFSYGNSTATEMMVACLKDTDFTFTGTDVTMKTRINYQEETNAKQITMAIANNWRGELQYHKYNVHLWQQRGQIRGVDFRFGKNIKGITKTTNRAERDEEGNPLVSYEIDVVELKHIEEYADLEYFELGDTVRIIDDMLGININARIVERTYNVLTETNESITVGNVVTDLSNSISKIKESIDEVEEIINSNAPDWDKIKAITNELGNVITTKLDGVIKTSQNKIENSTGTVSMIDNGILIHNQPTEEDSTWAMKLTSGGMAIASTKNEDGTWKWATMATGEGVVAEAITTGILSAITIDGVEITGTNITGGTINGVTMNGSTIYVGDRASGNYIELSPDNPVKVWRNNILVSSLGYSAIGGGNLTIYDRFGDKAFWAECLEDGDFQLFFNNDKARIPDPNNPGFTIPNPDSRKAWINAGNVIFNGIPRVQLNGELRSPLVNQAGLTSQIMAVEQKITQLGFRLDNHISFGTHSGYAKTNHSHTINYGGNPSHTHSMSNY